jgi:hypothetical protein
VTGRPEKQGHLSLLLEIYIPHFSALAMTPIITFDHEVELLALWKQLWHIILSVDEWLTLRGFAERSGRDAKARSARFATISRLRYQKHHNRQILTSSNHGRFISRR